MLPRLTLQQFILVLVIPECELKAINLKIKSHTYSSNLQGQRKSLATEVTLATLSLCYQHATEQISVIASEHMKHLDNESAKWTRLVQG